jgi:hypothetical protein
MKLHIIFARAANGVIGKDGSLTGFSAGVDKKRWLLDHEQRVLAASKNAASSKR